MGGKKIKFRVDGNNKVGIKEIVRKSRTARGNRISYTVVLTKDYSLSTRYVLKDNLFVVDKNKSKSGIYYLFNDVTYIVTLILQYNKKDQIVEKLLLFYLPSGFYSDTEIYCNRSISMIPEDIKERIINNIMVYISFKG